MTKVKLDNIAIVLQRPRYPENIGAAARAMMNMGIVDLIVVRPENFDIEKVEKLATHAASKRVKNIQHFDTLKDALAPFGCVIGTTARLGGQRQVIKSPSLLALKLADISQNNKVAIVFGPEDRGLSNQDLQLCHMLVNIPTHDFSSLNLAQAVMVMCYELHGATLEKSTCFAPRMASRVELDGMYDQLKKTLVDIAYINQENPDYWMSRMRRFFSRLPLRAGEVSIIRGICRQISWYGNMMYEKGKSRKKNKVS